MSNKLTIAQIIKFGDALTQCTETSLTFNEAKPYLIRHVEETGRPFKLGMFTDFPELVEINNCALGLNVDELLQLVFLVYGTVMEVPMTLFATPRVPLQEGARILALWASKEGVYGLPTKLERLLPHTKPADELVLFYHFASHDTDSVFANIFEFNRAVREYASKLRRAEMIDDMFDVLTKAGSHHMLRHGEVSVKFMREFCDLVNKFISK